MAATPGNSAAAGEMYRRAVDIKPVHAARLIRACGAQCAAGRLPLAPGKTIDGGGGGGAGHRPGRGPVLFLVAPYEADAQMAYLARRGDVACVITEDSDLLAYGAPRVLLKMARDGSGEEVRAEDLPAARLLPWAGGGGGGPDPPPPPPPGGASSSRVVPSSCSAPASSLSAGGSAGEQQQQQRGDGGTAPPCSSPLPPPSSGPSQPPPPPGDAAAAAAPAPAASDLFLQLCVLAGCDFLPSLPSVGLRTAARHLSRLRCAHRVVRSLRLAGKRVPAGYEEGLCRALWTFKHQTVFCPHSLECVPLGPLPEVAAADDDKAAAGGRSGDRAARRRVLVPPAAAVGVPTVRDLDFLGPLVPAEIAAAVAACVVDPMTRLPFTREQLMPTAAAARGGGGGWQQQQQRRPHHSHPSHHQSHHRHQQQQQPQQLQQQRPQAASSIAALFARAASAGATAPQLQHPASRPPPRELRRSSARPRPRARRSRRPGPRPLAPLPPGRRSPRGAVRVSPRPSAPGGGPSG